MFKHMLVPAMLVGALALSGCVSTKNVKADMAQLRSAAPATVTVSARKRPDFAAMTAGKAAFGMVGALAMISAGNTLVEENGVEDPAGYIAAQLSQRLSESLGVRSVDNGGTLADTAKAAELARLYRNADLLLDVQTVNWSFVYFPTDWNSYRVIYSAKLRLIDTRTGKLQAEGFCARVPEYSDAAPSRDALLADRAAGLKSELKVAADHCIGEFQAKVFGA